MLIEVPNGEVVDRATILQIKLERLNLGVNDSMEMSLELDELLEGAEQFGISEKSNMYRRLKQINEYLWDAVAEQKELMEMDPNCVSNDSFEDVSRKVVRLNNSRFEVKRAIDQMTNSDMLEFKETRQ